IAIRKVFAGNIYAHDQVAPGGRNVYPLFELRASLLQYPDGDALDEPGFLRDWTKFVGRYETYLAVIPAEKTFQADQIAFLERSGALVMPQNCAAFGGWAVIAR